MSNASIAPTAPPARQKAPKSQAAFQSLVPQRQSPLQAKEGRIQTTTASQPVSSEWENQAMSDIMSHTEPNTELKISLALFSVVFFFIPTKHPYFSPIAASRSRDAPQPACPQHTHTPPQRPTRHPPSILRPLRTAFGNSLPQSLDTEQQHNAQHCESQRSYSPRQSRSIQKLKKDIRQKGNKKGKAG
jgi:hypothetical protein